MLLLLRLSPLASATLWRTLVGWVAAPWLGAIVPVLRILGLESAAWLLLVAWVLAVPFLAYRRAKIVVRRAEAREAERMAAIIAEGVRRGTSP